MNFSKKKFKIESLEKSNLTKPNVLEILKKKVSPFYNYSYNDQLNYKFKLVERNLKSLVRSIWKYAVDRGLEPPEWCVFNEEGISTHNSKCFEKAITVEPIISIKNDELNKGPYSFRNKCEFTIGFTNGDVLDIDSDISIGFVSHIDRFEPIVIGLTKTTSTTKSDLKTSLEIIHPSMVPILKKMENVVTSSSKENDFKVYSRRERRGIWRLLLIRVSETHKELMITVQTTNLELSIKQKLVEILLDEFLRDEQSANKKDLDFSDYKIVSIYLHQSNSIVDTFEKGKLELLWGRSELNYRISNTNLSVGPLSFFQTNTKGCEILYTVIKNIILNEILDSSKKKKFYILDICCGVGAIGLTVFDFLMNSEKYLEDIELIGIDCSEEAIELAKRNAIMNQVKCSNYIAGMAEDVLPNFLSELPIKDSEVIAIVDPPRNGLHYNVIKSLREETRIKSLIYISCNIESLIKNCGDLCCTFDPVKDKVNCRPTFEPKYAIPVDMFPFTKHTEVVLYLCRKDDRNTAKTKTTTKVLKNPLLK